MRTCIVALTIVALAASLQTPAAAKAVCASGDRGGGGRLYGHANSKTPPQPGGGQVNADSGKLVWKTKLKGGGINSSAAVFDGKVFVGVSRVGKPAVAALD